MAQPVARLLRRSFRIVSYGDVGGPLLRAAVLADLALQHRIALSGDGVGVIGAPAGFPPGDVLLEHLEGRPNDPLLRWLRRGPTLKPVVGEWLVNAGYWQPRSSFSLPLGAHFRDLAPESTEQLRAELHGVTSCHDQHPAVLATAAGLAQLAAVFGAGSRLPEAELVAQCGAAEPIVRAAMSVVAWAAGTGAAIGNTSGGTSR